ncbi:hypothetical protein [Deinococcus aluminii]|uniref:Uncharacterized protein n=1 Tax=Deinococcus aluminii TaxID=1656885 RepID=A0ABP9XHI5_9DEIO
MLLAPGVPTSQNFGQGVVLLTVLGDEGCREVMRLDHTPPVREEGEGGRGVPHYAGGGHGEVKGGEPGEVAEAGGFVEAAHPLCGDEGNLLALLSHVPYPVQWMLEVQTPTFDGAAILLPTHAATQGKDNIMIVRTWPAAELADAHGDGADPLHVQVEADCAGVAVCEMWGINAWVSAADHVAVWGGKPKKLKCSLGHIVAVAEQLLTVLLPLAQKLHAQTAE